MAEGSGFPLAHGPRVCALLLDGLDCVVGWVSAFPPAQGARGPAPQSAPHPQSLHMRYRLLLLMQRAYGCPAQWAQFCAIARPQWTQFSTWSPGTSPHAPGSVRVQVSMTTANVSWEPGYDGGFEQTFSVWYGPL